MGGTKNTDDISDSKSLNLRNQVTPPSVPQRNPDSTGSGRHGSVDIFDRIYESSPEFIAISVDNTCRYINTAGARFLGARTPDDLTGRNIFDMIDPIHYETVRECIEALFKYQTSIQDIKASLAHMDGSSIPVDLSVCMVPFHGQRAQLFFAKSMAPSSKANEEPADNRDRYRQLIESLDDIVWEVDLDGDFRYLSPSIQDVLGFRSEELIGKTANTIMPPSESHRLESLFREIADQYDPLEAVEVMFLHKDGRIVFIEISGLPFFNHLGCLVGYRGLGRDITARKEIERHMQFQAQLLDSVREAIIGTDLKEYITYWGKGAEDLYGYQEGEALGRPRTGFLESSSPEEARQRRDEVIQNGHWIGLLEQKRKDGSTLWVETFISLAKDRNDQPFGLICIERDISDRKKTDDMLSIRTKQLAARVQELNCLFEISKLLEQADMSLDEIMQGIVELVPKGWQYPDNTCARILLAGNSYQTMNFEETNWKQKTSLRVKGRPVGSLEIYYKEPKPTMDEGPFILEERSLLNAIGEMLERITARKEAEDALKESEEKANTILNAAEEAMALIDRSGRMIMVNQTFAARFRSAVDELTGSRLGEVSESEFNQSLMARIMEVYATGRSVRFEDQQEGMILENSLYPVFGSSGQVILVAIYSRDITEQIKAQVEVLAYQQKLRALTTELSVAEEKERRQIALDLHDSVGQLLAVAQIKLSRLRECDLPEDCLTDVEDIIKYIETAASDTKSLTCQLHPPSLDVFGLEVAIDEFAEHLAEEHGLKAEVRDDGRKKPMAPDYRVVVYRIVRELMINVVKHAHASKLTITLNKRHLDLVIWIEDDGIGMDPSILAASQDQKSLGLVSVRERLNYMGGTMAIDSKPGEGTRTIIKVPLQQ